MKKLFYMIDFCSSGPELKIQGNDRKKSILGASISLIIACIMIFLVIYLGIDVIQKRKPQVIISNIEGEDPIYYKLTSKDLLLGWKITDENTRTLDYHEYLIVKVLSIVAVKSGSGSNPWVNTEVTFSDDDTTCDKIEDNKGRAADSILASLHCAKNLHFTLGGGYSDFKYGSIQVIVNPCIGYDYCKSQSEIEAFINQSLYFVLWFPDSSINPKSFETPISTSYSPSLIGISNGISVTLNKNYQNLIISSDKGFLLEDYTYIYTYQFDYDSYIYRTRTFTGYYAWITLLLQAKQLTYERTYLKVQDVAASVGGLFKIFWIAGILFMYPISKKGVEKEIMNQIYDFAQFNDPNSVADYDLKYTNSKKSNFHSKIFSKSKSQHNEKEVNIPVNKDNMTAIQNNSNFNGHDNNLILKENKELRNMTNNNEKDCKNKSINKKSNSNLNISTNTNLFASNFLLNQRSSVQVNSNMLSKYESSNNISNENIISNLNKFDKDKAIKNLSPFVENDDMAYRENINNDKHKSNLQNSSNDDDGQVKKASINNLNLNNSNVYRSKVEMIGNNFVNRVQNYRLRFSQYDLLAYLWCCNKCKSKQHLYKLNQYYTCLDEVNEISNFDYIIKKIKEIEFIKSIIFNREQAMAFNYFHKPLIGEKDQKFSKAANIIHHDLFEMSRNDQINDITNYFVQVANMVSIDEYDAKILDLLDVQY